ncbi:MAG: XTP/dITP diphosphatase [Lachnospiraceae bacterium]|nr:XTP/dITP diphosphatase [Lachnospiraceae bacterium]
MKKIIVATCNQDKIKEIREILAGDGIEYVSLEDEGLSGINITEDGSTFEENAVIKAKTVSEATGLMVLADDSGLEVDYLGGAPGIYSARYMGEDTPYTIKNNHIIEELKDAEGDERSARFVCVMACAFPDGRVITTEGKIEGQIAYEEKGENGFGYDPVFYLPEKGCTTAQLKPEEKNAISHRGRALRAMNKKLAEEGII